MSKLKTRPNNASVEDFLATIENEEKRKDSQRIVEIMQEETGCPPQMWGSSIIGFGTYHYKYESGREGDWMLSGFSPRKQSLTFYIMAGLSSAEDILADLGKHKRGKSCLYVKKLADIDEAILRKLIQFSLKRIEEIYGGK